MISNVTIETRDAGKTHGGCGCGCGDTGIPRLVARNLPKKIRHGAIVGALQSLQPGDQMELVAPHEPRRLLQQIDSAFPGAFATETVADDSEGYIVRFTRQ